MTTWFISRHLGALHWMQQNHIAFDRHCEHLNLTDIRAGDVVIGSLPINLVASLCAIGAEYWHLSLQVPARARGQELSAEDLMAYEAKLERYVAIRKEDTKKPR